MTATFFEGGNLTLKSGGIGPDDYLFRKIGSRCWFKVVIRHGPNQSEEYHADLKALSVIYRRLSERLCLGETQQIERRQREKIQTLSASEFVSRFLDVIES